MQKIGVSRPEQLVSHTLINEANRPLTDANYAAEMSFRIVEKLTKVIVIT